MLTHQLIPEGTTAPLYLHGWVLTVLTTQAKFYMIYTSLVPTKIVKQFRTWTLFRLHFLYNEVF